jgi:hypothetical protein
MRKGMLLFAALTLGAPATAQVERLDPEHQPVVRDFQKSKGRARLVTILSPT